MLKGSVMTARQKDLLACGEIFVFLLLRQHFRQFKRFFSEYIVRMKYLKNIM